MLIRIVIVATMTIFLVMIITLSLRRKPNLKPFVGIETRESFFGWRLEGTAGKLLLNKKIFGQWGGLREWGSWGLGRWWWGWEALVVKSVTDVSSAPTSWRIYQFI